MTRPKTPILSEEEIVRRLAIQQHPELGDRLNEIELKDSVILREARYAAEVSERLSTGRRLDIKGFDNIPKERRREILGMATNGEFLDREKKYRGLIDRVRRGELPQEPTPSWVSSINSLKEAKIIVDLKLNTVHVGENANATETSIRWGINEGIADVSRSYVFGSVRGMGGNINVNRPSNLIFLELDHLQIKLSRDEIIMASRILVEQFDQNSRVTIIAPASDTTFDKRTFSLGELSKLKLATE